jgi:hypothetical protein
MVNDGGPRSGTAGKAGRFSGLCFGKSARQTAELNECSLLDEAAACEHFPMEFGTAGCHFTRSWLTSGMIPFLSTQPTGQARRPGGEDHWRDNIHLLKDDDRQFAGPKGSSRAWF